MYLVIRFKMPHLDRPHLVPHETDRWHFMHRENAEAFVAEQKPLKSVFYEIQKIMFMDVADYPTS